MNKHNLIQSALIGASVTVVFVVLITIAGELYKIEAGGKMINPIKELLKSLHGHHWVGKSIWSILLFVSATLGTYFVSRNDTNESRLHLYVSLLTGLIAIGTAVLFGFFTYEYLVSH